MKLQPLTRVTLIALAICAAPPAIAQVGDRFFVEVTQTETPGPQGDVLDVAAATGQYTQFLAAVQAAGYEETLRGEGPFTIFAPTDEAFRQMRRSERERLMQPENREELLALLAYHVVAERVTTQTVGGAVVRPEASSGYRVTIDGRDGLRINDQLVVMPDVEASNGVIQGINTVLSPPTLIAHARSERGR
jgi:uncharacterized surface protein with fasciclin (FAS1) repeats